MNIVVLMITITAHLQPTTLSPLHECTHGHMLWTMETTHGHMGGGGGGTPSASLLHTHTLLAETLRAHTLRWPLCLSWACMPFYSVWASLVLGRGVDFHSANETDYLG